MPVIACSNIQKTYGARAALDDVSLTIHSGERVGVVGRSGSGKSTLGRILAGVEEPDLGEVSRRRGARVELLAQEPRLPEGSSARDVVLASLTDWNEATRRHEALTRALGENPANVDRLIAQQAEAAEEVERRGGWERMHEAEAIIGHLGIDDPGRVVDTMSGGERRRVALARILVGRPDLAILDEPTNHLDLEAIEWLERHLLDQFRGAVLLITHDRYVLDRVATRTFELHDGAISIFSGGYASYLAAKAERAAHAERVERNRQNFLRRELDWFRSQPKARGTKQKARMDRVRDALDARPIGQEKDLDLRASSERLGKTILRLSGLGIERDGKRLVSDLDLDLMPGERIGIVGPNGSGKTSLLLCIQGKLEPVAGEWTLGSNTRIGYLDQARAGLDDDATVREAVAGDRAVVQVAGEELTIGSYLERFLFSHADQRKRVGVLSGGERARIGLARLLAQKTNLLLLDEPTNDLDVSTLGALESMLLDYRGSALIVSHDRWFLDRVATSILAFEPEGRLDLHRGNYSRWREKKNPERSAREPRTRKAVPKREADDEPAKPSRPRKLSWAEERELEGLFDAIEAAESEVSSLEQRLSDPATYERRGDTVAALSRALEAAQAEAARLTTRWEELEARKAEISAS